MRYRGRTAILLQIIRTLENHGIAFLGDPATTPGVQLQKRRKKIGSADERLVAGVGTRRLCGRSIGRSFCLWSEREPYDTPTLKRFRVRSTCHHLSQFRQCRAPSCLCNVAS